MQVLSYRSDKHIESLCLLGLGLLYAFAYTFEKRVCCADHRIGAVQERNIELLDEFVLVLLSGVGIRGNGKPFQALQHSYVPLFFPLVLLPSALEVFISYQTKGGYCYWDTDL